jgi:RNA polymerase sigma factor (sigma-70 family)
MGPPGGDDGDGELLRRFAADRDEAAFATLVRRHGPMVWSVCSRLLSQQQDAEDAFQATFLILVRKAGGLRRPDSLSPWLYGVARRVALKTRHAVTRRRAREQEVIDLPAPQDTELIWRDLRPLLDEEVGRLPEKYRLPFVLCYLEGVTNEEAARRLRCPKGTVLSRLSRARQRLRGRLVRRGVELSGAALATVLTSNAGPAAVPAALITDTVRTGLAFAAGCAGAGSAVSLATGVLHSMFVTKLKWTVVALLALCVVGSGVSFAGRRAAADGPKGDSPAPTKSADKVKDMPPAADAKQAKVPSEKPPLPRGMDLAQILTKPVDFKGFDDPKITLAEGLDALARLFNVSFDIDEHAFGPLIDEASKVEIAQPLPIPPMRATLQHVLRKILTRLPADSGATFVIRKDHIQITTQKAIRKELGIPDDRALLPLVYEEFDDEPLPKALRKLADASGFSVVLDRQGVADDKFPRVAAHFHNVPVDTAVRVLADMADLGMVQLDNVLYLTSREKALRLKAEQMPAPAPKPMPAAKDKGGM